MDMAAAAAGGAGSRATAMQIEVVAQDGGGGGDYNKTAAAAAAAGAGANARQRNRLHLHRQPQIRRWVSSLRLEHQDLSAAALVSRHLPPTGPHHTKPHPLSSDPPVRGRVQKAWPWIFSFRFSPSVIYTVSHWVYKFIILSHHFPWFFCDTYVQSFVFYRIMEIVFKLN